MSSLSAQYNAINLGQGFPDFGTSSELTSLVHKAMQEGHNQYAHMNGVPALRDGIAEKVFELYQQQVEAGEEITITPGGTYAIYTALTCILQPGDEVIVFEPAYDSYIPNIEINGAVAVPIALEHPDYHINWELVRSKLTAKTKAIIINSPHNPTGALLGENDISALQALVKDSDIFIISDEVYEHIVFDDKKHLSILKYPDLYERAFVCFSFGKVYHCTGWKLGYCIAPPSLMKEFRKIHQFNSFTCNSPMQYALAEFIQQTDAYNQLGKFLQAKRDFFRDAMQQTRFTPLPSHGSYFQLYSYATISDEPENVFAVRLIKEFGVAGIPVSAFYQIPREQQVIRFCFAKKEATLEAAALKLKNV